MCFKAQHFSCLCLCVVQPHAIYLRPTSVACLRPPWNASVGLSSGWMHPTHISYFLGNFSRNVPEATLGIVGGNFRYKTKEMSGIIIYNYCCFFIFYFLISVVVLLNQVGFPLQKTPLKVFLSQCTYRYLLSLHPFPCHCFLILSHQHPQGTEQLLNVYMKGLQRITVPIYGTFSSTQGERQQGGNMATQRLLCPVSSRYSLWNAMIGHSTGNNDHTVVLVDCLRFQQESL